MNLREQAHKLTDLIHVYITCHGDLTPGLIHDFLCDDVLKILMDVADIEFVKGYDQCQEDYDFGTE